MFHLHNRVYQSNYLLPMNKYAIILPNHDLFHDAYLPLLRK